MHGRLDSPELRADLPDVPGRAADLDLGRAARAACRGPTGRAPSITGCPLDLYAGPRRTARYLAFVGRISPEKRVDRAVEIARAAGHAAEDRRQDRRQGSRLLRERDQAAVRRSAGRIRGRDRRAGEERVPGRRGGAAVPDRLAGAVRPGDDRGDGVRHAGGRVPLRLGARGDARRRVRVRRRDARRGGGRHGARREAAARGVPRVLREALLGAADGGGLRRDLRGDDRNVRRDQGRGGHAAFGLAAIDAEADGRRPRGRGLGGEQV